MLETKLPFLNSNSFTLIIALWSTDGCNWGTIGYHIPWVSWRKTTYTWNERVTIRIIIILNSKDCSWLAGRVTSMPYQRLLPQSNRVREKTLMFCNSSNRCLQPITKCSFSPSLAFYSSCNREKTSSCKSNYFKKVTIIQIISIHTPPKLKEKYKSRFCCKNLDRFSVRETTASHTLLCSRNASVITLLHLSAYHRFLEWQTGWCQDSWR